MMINFPDTARPPFVSGLAIFIIGLYLAIEGYFGKRFSGCILPMKKKCCDEGACKK